MPPQLFALDFGTTNSLLACWQPETQSARLLHLPGLSQPDGMMPSLVYANPHGQPPVAGAQVFADGLHLRRDQRLFRNFKREMLENTIPPRFFDGELWDARRAGAVFLQQMFAALPVPLAQVSQWVMTVPVVAFDVYMRWLKEHLPPELHERLRFVDESTAAALGYAVRQPGSLVFVFDFGGGSLDVSLVQLPQSGQRAAAFLRTLLNPKAGRDTARVIAKSGLALGGSDVDRWLVDAVRAALGEQAHALLPEDDASLLYACEQAKIALSTQESTVIQVPLGSSDFALRYTRTQLAHLLEQHGFFEQITQCVQKTLHFAGQRGIFAEDVQAVLLVGGSSQMPVLQQMLQARFPKAALYADKPFTAVVEGALYLAAGLGLEDYLLHSYGAWLHNPQTGRAYWREIFPAGSRYPSEKPAVLTLQAAHPQQARVTLQAGEIHLQEVSAVSVVEEGGQTLVVAQLAEESLQVLPFSAAPTLTLLPPAQLDVPRLRCEWQIDAARQILLTVTDLHNGKTLLQNHILLPPDAAQSQSVLPGCKDLPAVQPSQVTARRQLSLRNLGSLLNTLPPEAISLEALAYALQSADFYVRYSAAESLCRRTDPEAYSLLENLFVNGAAPLRASLAAHLHRLSWLSAEPLLRRALTDSDQRVREAVVYGLCWRGDAFALQLLESALPSQNEWVWSAAAWGLAAHPSAGAVGALGVVMRSEVSDTLVKALEALAAGESLAAVPYVRAALDNPDLAVQYAAVLSLIELQQADALPELAQRILLANGARCAALLRGVFHATNYLLISIGTLPAAEDVIAAASHALRDALPETRVQALMLLAWMRHPLAQATLLQGYSREPLAAIRAQMLFRAVSLMSPAAAVLLDLAEQDSEAEVQAMSAHLRARLAKP